MVSVGVVTLDSAVSFLDCTRTFSQLCSIAHPTASAVHCFSRNDALTPEGFQQREDKFLNFLRGVMLNRENIKLDTFKLKWCRNGRDTHIRVCSFLEVAVMCSPRVLSIHINMGTFFDLPDSIFVCTSVEKMTLWLLTNGFYILQPRSINLPFLKNLELGLMPLTDVSMRMLISGCPVLEELVLDSCYLELNMISSNVLKKLVLNYCGQHGWQMEISCPGVVSLSIIRGKYTGSITLTNMSSLATANFLFRGEDKDGPSNLDLRLLGGLSNVTTLKLRTNYRDVMVLLLADIPNCPTLKNLESLELGAWRIGF
ncbi:F-box/LRR-repeat protein At4g14103-like [Carex rostrata]